MRKVYCTFEVLLKPGSEPTFEDYKRPKTLLVLYKKHLMILKERASEWEFYNDSVADMNELFSTKNVSATMKDPKIVAIQSYLALQKKLDLQKLTEVVLDENGLSILDLNFGSYILLPEMNSNRINSDRVKILFGCDAAREKFRIALVRTLVTTTFFEQVITDNHRASTGPNNKCITNV